MRCQFGPVRVCRARQVNVRVQPLVGQQQVGVGRCLEGVGGDEGLDAVVVGVWRTAWRPIPSAPRRAIATGSACVRRIPVRPCPACSAPITSMPVSMRCSCANMPRRLALSGMRAKSRKSISVAMTALSILLSLRTAAGSRPIYLSIAQAFTGC